MAITNENEEKNSLQLGDHDSEIFTFELPRKIDGHSMDLCDVVRVHFINTSTSKTDQSKDVYKVTDMRPAEDDPETLVFPWKISGNATKYAGNLAFRILFACSDGEGGYSYKKWTDVFKDIYIRDGFDNSEAAVADYSDILEQWEKELFGTGDSVIENIKATGAEKLEALQNEGEAQKNAIEAKGAETLATIPEDYTATYNMAKEGARTKADAIVQTAQGEAIVATDCSGGHVRGLKVFGKTIQGADPSPEYPQELVSVENPRIMLAGVNLADVKNMEVHANQSLSISEDGYTIVATGGADKPYTSSIIEMDVAMLKGKKILLKADKITNTNTAAHGVVQLNISTPNGTFYLPISTYALIKEIDVPADATKIVLSVYTNNTETALSADNTNTVEGLGVFVADMPWGKYKEVQCLAVPRTLHAIPVSSGGNYTDASGQQWVGDYVDLGKGQLVQQVGIKVINGTLAPTVFAAGNNGGTVLGYSYDEIGMVKILRERCNKLCDKLLPYVTINPDSYKNCTIGHWIFNSAGSGDSFMLFNVGEFESASEAQEWLAENPITVYFVLKEPIITPLTTEEIEAFKALRTNYLTTTVLNDAGAWMELSYNADTKKYVENATTADSLTLVDQNTGKKYKLVVVNGQLSTSEVA